jgi:hypothetical protein
MLSFCKTAGDTLFVFFGVILYFSHNQTVTPTVVSNSNISCDETIKTNQITLKLECDNRKIIATKNTSDDINLQIKPTLLSSIIPEMVSLDQLKKVSIYVNTP